MRGAGRIKLIIAELEKYWTKNPDLRLCQIIGNILETTKQCPYCMGSGFIMRLGKHECCIRCLSSGYVDVSTYNVEDDIILKKLTELNLQHEMKERLSWGAM